MTDYKEYIYAVYTEKSFSRAAQKLHVSQPWLSAAVKKVEKELGLPLFDRTTTPISLTEAGAYYIKRVEQIMTIEREMRDDLKRMHDSEASEIHIGSSMFFCTYVLPNLLADFRTMYPQATVSFSEGSSQALQEKLQEGKLDFLLEAEMPTTNRLHVVSWASEELVLAVPTCYEINHKLAAYRYTFDEILHRDWPECKKPPVSLEVFRDEPFLLLKEGNDSHDRFLQICRNAGFTPTVKMYLSQMMSAYYLVCEGRGITFLRSTIPEHVHPSDDVVFYRLDDPLAMRDIYLSYPKERISPMRQHLIDFMKENANPGQSML